HEGARRRVARRWQENSLVSICMARFQIAMRSPHRAKSAHDEETARLQARIEDLELRVKLLEARVRALSAAPIRPGATGRRAGHAVVSKLFHQKTSDKGYAREMAEVSRVINALPYPGILHVVEVGLFKKRLAVVREDVDGFNLGVALQRLNTKEVLLPPQVALSVVM